MSKNPLILGCVADRQLLDGDYSTARGPRRGELAAGLSFDTQTMGQYLTIPELAQLKFEQLAVESYEKITASIQNTVRAAVLALDINLQTLLGEWRQTR